MIPTENLSALSIHNKELLLLMAELEDWWWALIVRYLWDKVEPTSKEKSKKLRYRAFHYLLIDGVLYKQGQSLPFLRCLDDEEADYVLREIHEGICSKNSRGQLLSHKVLR